MCGICGFLEMTMPSAACDAEQHLLRMCREMEHRGPDDLGLYISETGAGLGAVRLSILDLAGGHQPLSNEDGSCWVALNGEIYNFPVLKASLQKLGHKFRTNCDTEAVVHAYEEWGDSFVQHLEGMFALAIWDTKRRRMLLARDRLGKKPLYYMLHAKTFVFSSEIKSLLKHPATQGVLDNEALDSFLTLGYIPGPMTIFQNVKKLDPAHSLVIEPGKEIATQRYWDIPEADPTQAFTGDIQEAAHELQNLLEQSVKSRLLADVPVGVFLSGGLDSSIVTALMKRHKPDQLKSFSVSFRDPEQNEAPFASVVAKHIGTEHYELATNECPPDLIRKLVWFSDEPLADPAVVPTYLVSKLAREQVKVVLTGEGADELFAGYFYYPLEKKSSQLDWMPAWAKQTVLVKAAQATNHILGRQRYHPRTLWSWQLDPSQRMLAWMSIFTDLEKKRWFSTKINTVAARNISAKHFKKLARPYQQQKWLSHFAYLDAKIPLVDDLLMKVDKMSMAASLEARCPFLDQRVVEFASTLPEAMKMNGAENKIILRKVAASLLPKEITQRKKHGFDVPLRRWLTEDLRDYFWDLVSCQSFERSEVITRPMVQEIWKEMEQNVPNRTRQVWSILILATWFDSVLS